MKKFIKKLAKKAEGFTLVELVVVIAILGILAGVAVPAYSGYLEKAREAGDLTQLEAIKTAAMGAAAEDGAVTSITVGTSSGTVNSVKVAVDNGTETEIFVSTHAYYSDFTDFYGSTTMPTLTSDQHSNGATWNAEDGWQ